MGSKQACPLLCRETLALSFKAFLYTNILEKMVQNKRQAVPHIRYLETWETTENCHPALRTYSSMLLTVQTGDLWENSI